MDAIDRLGGAGTGRVGAIALLAVSVWGGAVSAATPADAARADVLFREGRAALQRGELGEACPKLEESYALDPAAGTAVNLGDCFEKQGKVGSALLAYRAARTLLKPGDGRIPLVDKHIADLEVRTPKLRVTLAVGAPADTVVKRDGKRSPVGVLSPVNPGKHQIVVHAPGRSEATYSVTVKEGEVRDVVVEAGDGGDGPTDVTSGAPAAANKSGEKATPAESSSGSEQRTLGYVLGGAGVLATIWGGVKFSDHLDGQERLDELCPTAGECAQEAEYKRLEPDVSADGRNAALGIGFGLAAVAGGIALVVFAPDGTPRQSARVSPVITSSALGAAVGGRF